jgi:ATP-dependent DNA helicase RecQ
LNTPIKILREFFGYDSFRSGQEEIIDAVIRYNNVLAVLPTGAGKSICYQIPALLSENFSIVVSPLIALMKDQVDNLNSKIQTAAFINSTMSFPETEEVLNKISLGSIKLLYLAPEKIESLKFAERIKALKPANLFVDEAHCISEWGHNFRPSYMKIKDFINHTGIKKVSAFTATATPEVREDIILQLGFKDAKIFVRGFERENLNLRILHTKKKNAKCYELLKEINGPAIIYTASRKKAEEAAEFLNLKGILCNYYHAGLSAPERRRVQEEFIQGRINVIAATNAFGMGIDKPDIRLIIHYNTPGSVESYYQEIGRAGRDGKESFCYLLYHESDLAIQNFFISNSHPNKEMIQKIYKAICDYNQIAVGSTSEKELIVDKDYISKYTGSEISPGLLNSTIRYLENSGYIRPVSEYDKKDSLQILMGKEKLKQFVQNSPYPELADVLILLVREFGASIFTSAVQISLAGLSAKFTIPLKSFTDSLNILDNMGIVLFRKAIEKDTVILTASRVNTENLNLNYKLINESYLRARLKLDKMLELVFTNECRFRNILNYFGENISDYRCGKCDNCTSTGKLKDSLAAYLSDIIIETLEEANGELPENFLIKLLRGEKVKESASLFRHFGACKKFTSAEIRGVLADQISKGKILKNTGKKNYLSLPGAEKDKPEITTESIKQIRETKSYEDDLYLYNHLREARKKAADRFMQPAYLICPDNVLRDIARIKPANKNELLRINGFNSRMFNKAGNDFLEVINSHKPGAAFKEETGTRTELPQNIAETMKLLQKKYTLKEIAETRKLSEAVVSMQIETIIEFEPGIDISSVITKERFKMISDEAEKGFENLKELKEKLAPQITYPEIRIVVAKLRATSQRSASSVQHKQ